MNTRNPELDAVDLAANELGARSHTEGHHGFIDLHDRAPDVALAIGDRYPELHARLSVPPRRERTTGATSVEYHREGGRWAAKAIEVRGRRHARRARRMHPSATVTVAAPATSRILGRAPRRATNRRRRGSRRAAAPRGDPDDGDADPADLESAGALT